MKDKGYRCVFCGHPFDDVLDFRLHYKEVHYRDVDHIKEKEDEMIEERDDGVFCGKCDEKLDTSVFTDVFFCRKCGRIFQKENGEYVKVDGILDPVSHAPVHEGYHEKKWDQEKLRWDLLYWEGIEKVVEIATYGIEKGYKEESWKDVMDGQERYFSALMRHLIAWRKGEITDPESKRPHLWHAAWNALALIYFEEKRYPMDDLERWR